MRNVGRKRQLGNGILQRLGIDDDQPIHHFSTTKNDSKKTSPFDFLRCSTTTWKHRKSNVDADVRVDKDDVDSESSDVERSSVGPNPLFALKELCNNTCTKMTTSTSGRRTKTTQKSDDSNGRSSSLSSSSSSETSTPKNSDENAKNQNVDDENNGVVKRSIEPQFLSSEDENENDDEKVGRHHQQTKKTGIRVKNAKELLRTRRPRIPRNESSHIDASKTPPENVASSENASQSATEAKFFRYSELAKVLAAGN